MPARPPRREEQPATFSGTRCKIVSGFPSSEEAARPTARNEAQNSVKRNCQLSQFTWHWLSETERIIANSMTLSELEMSINRI